MNRRQMHSYIKFQIKKSSSILNHFMCSKAHNDQGQEIFTFHVMIWKKERVENQPIWRAEEDAATFWLVWAWTGVYYAPIWWMLESFELNYVNFSLKPHLPLKGAWRKQNNKWTSSWFFTLGNSSQQWWMVKQCELARVPWSFWAEYCKMPKSQEWESVSFLVCKGYS